MTGPEFLTLAFWLSATALLFTFAGYPWLVRFLANVFPRSAIKSRPPHPLSVSVLMAVHDEAPRILSRIRNLLASTYPADRFNLLIVSDGSTDATTVQIRSLASQRIQLVEQPARLGKAHCLNTALAAATAEIIVFADVRQRFEPETIQELADNFSDPRVGAASGALEIDPANSAAGIGVDAYWKLEKKLRHAEARLDSCIGCTGAVYAIRRSLFQPIPADTILDDVVIPMQIALQGYRVVFDPQARAYDPQALEPAPENIRKRRTLAGNFQMLVRHPHWLLPWRNRLWWRLISHKYLRLASPAFLAIMALSNVALLSQPFYRLLFLVQCAFYGLAAAGLAFPALRTPLISLPAGFVFLNFMTIQGLWLFLCGAPGGAWQTARPGPGFTQRQEHV